ncbi:MAG: NADH-dependent phenylglyoxylate dehydrogenase subunit gamma [Syntrophaceae bacterium PtaB.Bin095]|nr:MAG: NADH-dependent phenylglyoxylate dehydrogenase subunit gamma [Syntrophaceae bacterium PtaB.Bin095]
MVVAAQILAEAAYLEGFKGVTSAPTFGPERRGAPLTASTRIADDPIRTFSQIEFADITVVLDDSLFDVVDILGKVRAGGLLIINTTRPADHFKVPAEIGLATVDAATVSIKQHLIKEGAPVVNTPMLGAFARASGMVSLDNLEKALRGKLSREAVLKNFASVKAAYEATEVREKRGGRG